MKRLLKWLEDIFWPRGLKCLCCDEYAPEDLLCPQCKKELAASRLAFPGRSVYRYDGVAKHLVLLLKGECVADAAIPLAQGLAEAIREMELPPDTVLTWVTMPEMRRRKRGIDHGRVLCEATAGMTGLPARQLLSRTGNLHTQRGLNREQRLKNLTGTILCTESVNCPVLLIDDVMTTGATSAVCAEALLNAGAPQVAVLTATRVMLRNQYQEPVEKG